MQVTVVWLVWLQLERTKWGNVNASCPSDEESHHKSLQHDPRQLYAMH